MQTVIYLLRHGETVLNAAARYQGQEDSPLTERGVDQANLMAGLLSREIAGNEKHFKGNVSPLGRAKETASYITRATHVAFIDEPRLMEVTVGTWDEMSLSEINAQYPRALRARMNMTGIFVLRMANRSTAPAEGSHLGSQKSRPRQLQFHTD